LLQVKNVEPRRKYFFINLRLENDFLHSLENKYTAGFKKENVMVRFSIVILIASLGLGAFSIWGLFAAGGRRNFDEMDGMYPFFAGCAAILLAVIGGLMLGVGLWQSHRNRLHDSP